MRGPALLLFSTGSHDPDFRYACGMDIEQGLYVSFAEGDDWLVVPRLELERAQAQARVGRISDRAELGWTEDFEPHAAWVEVAARVLAERSCKAVRVSPRLPAVYFVQLQRRGLDIEVAEELFPQRRRKSAQEAAWIRDAQRAAEAACLEIIRCLAAAEPAADGILFLEGRPLSSERLRSRAQMVLGELGHSAAEVIVAGPPDSALPHLRGTGPIRVGGPVVIDLAPRGEAGYHGDLTRTLVPGGAGAQVRSMHEACLAALESALACLRAGVDGREVHRTVCRVLVERGYGTTTTGFEGSPDGPRMTHATGHGVGLEVHETPPLRDRSFPLQAGDVVAVEPGLYLPGLGGVRVEDTGMVTAEGFENFTSLPRSLDPGDYL